MEEPAAAVSPHDELRRRWPILLSAMIGLGAGIGAPGLCAALFVIPMQQESGWSRAAVTILPLAAMTAAFVAPFAGALIDRVSARRLVLGGLLALAATYLSLALMPLAKPFLYSAAVCLGLFGTCALAFTRGVAGSFMKSLGLALGLAASGSSIFGAVVVPVVRLVIESWGWRAGYIAIAGLIVLVAVPAVALGFRPGSTTRTDGTGLQTPQAGLSFKDAVSGSGFWLLLAASIAISLPWGGLGSQLYLIMVSKGLTGAQAVATVSVNTLAVGIGRVGVGWLLDRFRPGRVALAVFLIPAVGAMAISMADPGSLSWVLLAIIAFALGCAAGGEGDFGAYFSVRIFGLRAFATIVAVIAIFVGISIAAGGFAFAVAFDRFGNYDYALRAASVFLLLGGILINRIRV